MVNEKIKTFFNFLDKLFKVPRSYKLNHVNDDSDVISKAESETRIFWIIFVLGLFLNLGGSFVISILINLTKESPRYEIIETEYGEQISNNPLPVLQNLVLILADGRSLFFYIDKILDLRIMKTHKFSYDHCGFFAYNQIDHIQTLVGTQGKLNFIHDSNFNSKKILGSHLPSKSSGFSIDSTGVRFGNWFWFIGGENTCSDSNKNNFGDKGTRNPNSYLWSTKKKKWFEGPQYYPETKYAFHYSCGIALNSSAVLFVGLLKVKYEDSSDFANYAIKNEDFPNKYVCIYNFAINTWVEQDSLKFPIRGEHSFMYDYNPACVIEQNKNAKR